MEEEIRVAPLRRSLTRPRLIFGCDRVPFLLLVLVCVALGLPGGLAAGNYVNAALSVVIFVVGIKFLAAMTKYDPDALPVFRRAMRYNDKYSATSKALHPDRKF
ncbi:MAG: VirB3 family type IV secretion system protein [Synergistaceae bacterium]|nr:VirB3 family type IV secretion system protein [Synergistaceae bacterium]